MIDTKALVDDLVLALQDVKDLVDQMDGDAERIFAYHDEYPNRISLVHAIHTMPAPSIMAVWQGSEPGSFGGVDVWRHKVTLYLRARPAADKAASDYYALFRLIVKGEPTKVGQPMLNVTVHSSCYPMDLPSIQRQVDGEGLDYFEVPLSFTEIGDQ